MPKPSSSKVAGGTDERPSLYPDLEVRKCLGDQAMTADQAKQMLGWEEVPAGGGTPLLTDATGKKVRCTHNTRNRDFDEKWAYTLAQDLLNRNWADSRSGPDMTINGETVIFDRYGQCRSGQHRLVGLILAAQKWAGAQAEHWKEKWPTEPTMEALLVMGISDNKKVTRTLDNVKPRSLADALFADEGMFGSLTPDKRKRLCRMAENAVKFLWDRTGLKDNPYAPSRTHSECIEFLDRHPRLKRAVQHVATEDANGGLGWYSTPGYLSGLLYLMGLSGAEPEAVDGYFAGTSPAEADLGVKAKDKVWERAEEFVVALAQGGEDVAALHDLRRPGTNVGGGNLVFGHGEGSGSNKERWAWLVTAWHLFRQGKELTEESLGVADAYTVAASGELVLKEDRPLVGGIDRDRTEEGLADEEEAEENKAELDAEKDAELKAGQPPDDELLVRLHSGANRNRCILFRRPDGAHDVWGQDALAAHKALDTMELALRSRDRVHYVEIPAAKLMDSLSLLRVAGLKPLVAYQADDGEIKTEEPPARPKPAQKPAAEPADEPKATPNKPAQKPAASPNGKPGGKPAKRGKPALRGGTGN